MKHMRILSVLLAILLPLSAMLAGCGKNKGNAPDPTEDGEPVILEHVYRGTAFPLPEKWNLDTGVQPVWKDGALTCLASMIEEREDADGTLHSVRRTAVFTLTEGGEPVRRDLSPGENASVESGILSDTSLTYLLSDMDFETGSTKIFLGRYDLATGETTVSGDLAPQFDTGEHGLLFVNDIAADGDGDLYLASEQQVLILTPDFIRKGIVTAQSFVNSLTASSDGYVYVTGNFNEKMGFAAIDKETFSFGPAKPLPPNASDIFFGAGYDLYLMGESSVMGLTVGEDGDTVTETVCDFMNSDLSRSSAELISVIDADTLLIAERLDETDYIRIPVLYRHVPDVDLSKVPTVRVAYLGGIGSLPMRQITAYNRAHPECRAVVEDYTVYQTDEDYAAGYKKLALDMTAGTCRPDLVIGPYHCEAVDLLWEKGWYTDLMPFMREDDLVNPENVFGAVQHAFGTGNGGMWGIYPQFSVEVLLSTKELLGPYADKGWWTSAQMLDFAQSLPEDVTLILNLYRESAPYLLFGESGFGAFIDRENAVCSFEDPEFLRFLRYLKNLPTREEYRKTSPLLRLDRSQRYLPYFEGKIVLKRVGLLDALLLPDLETQFNTKDYVLIGNPSEENRPGAGNQVNPQGAAVITSFCRSPETAWEVVRTLFTGRLGRGIIPALKTEYDAAFAPYIQSGSVGWQYFDGSGGGSQPDDPEHPMTVDDLRSPGILFRYTKELADSFKPLLDEVGSPRAAIVNEEISDIINEEISAFCADACTAEECAKRIQSRVSIWLAEHK